MRRLLALVASSALAVVVVACTASGDRRGVIESFQSDDGGTTRDGAFDLATASADSLMAVAQASFATKPPGSGESALAWQLDEQPAQLAVGSDLTVELPEMLGPDLLPVVRLEAATSVASAPLEGEKAEPRFAVTMRSATAELRRGTYPCVQYKGSLRVASADGTSMTTVADGDAGTPIRACTLTVVMRLREEIPLDLLPTISPRTIIVGKVEATVVNSAGEEHSARGGFAVVESP